MHERRLDSLRSLTPADMSVAEQFLLGTCRCWNAFTADPDPTLPWRELVPVFAYMNVLGAMCAFECLFAVLARGSHRRLEFAGAQDERVWDDEARLLSALAALQAADTRAAVSVLRGVLPDPEVRAVIPPLARIASILDGQGHHLPRWQTAASSQSATSLRRPRWRDSSAEIS